MRHRLPLITVGLLAASIVLAPVAMAAPVAAPAAVHGADWPARSPIASSWDAWGELKARYNRLADFPIDNVGTTHGRDPWLATRVIAGAGFKPLSWLSGELEVEGLNGLAWGGTTAVGTRIGDDTFARYRDGNTGLTYPVLRKAKLRIDTPYGALIGGAMTFNWGLGLLANDGTGDRDFGDAWTGNVVDRVLFATKPLKTAAAGTRWADTLVYIGADSVVRDDNMFWPLGDRAYQGVLGIHSPGDALTLGLFAALRSQTDRSDANDLRYTANKTPTEVDVLAIDVWGRTVVALSPQRRVRIAAEAALITGTTTRPYLEETVAGADVLSFGGVLRATFEADDLHLTGRIEAGHASGDADPRDGTARQFTFHSDYKVGLLLFDHILPMLSARAVDRLADPGLTKATPGGMRFVVNQGAVRNATYLYGTARWRPVDHIDLRLGGLAAWSAGGLSDPYLSAKAGGWARSYGNSPDVNGMLGIEGLLGADIRVPFPGPVELGARIELAHFLPGSALDGTGMTDHTMLRSGLTVRW